MSAALASGAATPAGSIDFDVAEFGAGRPIVFLASGLWIADESPFIAQLESLGHVLTPIHPWFGEKPGPAGFSTADDLAYLYLDMLEARGLHDVLLIGAGFGGWIAAQMAIKSCERLAGLALIDPLGVKTGPREARDIVDVFATTDHDLETLAFADPAPFRQDQRSMPDDRLASRIRRREATARYGWSPYMHDPKLKDRLHRIKVPTLMLWGEADRIATPDYGRRYAALVPGARFEIIPGAGHFPHLERPAVVHEHLAGFLRQLPAASTR